MSIDDIRVQKGLALLEFHEAQQEVENLQAELGRLGLQFQQFGTAIGARPFSAHPSISEKHI